MEKKIKLFNRKGDLVLILAKEGDHVSTWGEVIPSKTYELLDPTDKCLAWGIPDTVANILNEKLNS